MTTQKKIRILFVGELISSHAQSWIGLLDNARDKFDVMAFGVPASPYPKTKNFCMFPPRGLFVGKFPAARLSPLLLRLLIKIYKPDVIHTFAAFPTTAIYASLIKEHKGNAKWVAQLRGGPDLFMNRFNADKNVILKDLFKNCDIIIADNDLNYSIAVDMGLEPSKRWSYGIAPGAGGMNLKEFTGSLKPSASKKQIIWHKAYEGYESKGLPVLEAIKIAWPRIEGTKFIFTAGNPGLNDYISLLPDEIRNSIDVRPRISRAEMLNLMKESRVVMAPSLLEGIPNALYESMAAQCVPLFSPLDTYKDKFKEKENVLYARNLYPEEIADALVQAVNDDALADKIAENNVALVEKIANREKLSGELVKLYETLGRGN